MDLSLTEDQRSIRDAVLAYCSQFSDEYWLERDHEGVFPYEFYKSMADSDWLGVAMPEALGGAGLGITEAAIMMQAVSDPHPTYRTGEPSYDPELPGRKGARSTQVLLKVGTIGTTPERGIENQ